MRHRHSEPAPSKTAPCAGGCKFRDRHLKDCVPTEDDPCTGCLPCPADDRSPLCRNCGKDFTEAIAKMPSLAFELLRGVAASNAVDDGPVAKMDESPDFSRARAAVEHLGQIAHDLAWLTRQVAGTRGITRPVLSITDAPLQAVQGAAVWLTVHVPWMLQQPDAPDWHGTIRSDRGRARWLIDRAPRARIDMPDRDPCPDCGSPMKATMHDVGDKRPNEVWCTGDPCHRFAPLQWPRLRRRLLQARQLAKQATEMAEQSA